MADVSGILAAGQGVQSPLGMAQQVTSLQGANLNNQLTQQQIKNSDISGQQLQQNLNTSQSTRAAQQLYALQAQNADGPTIHKFLDSKLQEGMNPIVYNQLKSNLPPATQPDGTPTPSSTYSPYLTSMIVANLGGREALDSLHGTPIQQNTGQELKTGIMGGVATPDYGKINWTNSTTVQRSPDQIAQPGSLRTQVDVPNADGSGTHKEWRDVPMTSGQIFKNLDPNNAARFDGSGNAITTPPSNSPYGGARPFVNGPKPGQAAPTTVAPTNSGVKQTPLGQVAATTVAPSGVRTDLAPPLTLQADADAGQKQKVSDQTQYNSNEHNNMLQGLYTLNRVLQNSKVDTGNGQGLRNAITGYLVQYGGLDPSKANDNATVEHALAMSLGGDSSDAHLAVQQLASGNINTAKGALLELTRNRLAAILKQKAGAGFHRDTPNEQYVSGKDQFNRDFDQLAFKLSLMPKDERTKTLATLPPEVQNRLFQQAQILKEKKLLGSDTGTNSFQGQTQ